MGTIETCGGSISAMRTTMKAASRPRQRRHESAYATGMLETRRPKVARAEYMNVFSAQRQSGAWLKTSMKFPQWNGCGQRSEDSAWFVLMSAVNVMKTKGARKSAARTISRLWFATPIRNRRRRTANGGLRRTSGAAAGAAAVTQ